MKKLAVILCVSLLFLGCNFNFFGDPSGEDICLKKPADAKSWLCEAAAKAGITLNQVDMALLDSSALTVIFAKIEVAKVAKFLDKAESYIDIESMTYTKLIEKLKIDETEAQLVKSILARHVDIFQSDMFISQWDQYLMRLEIQRQREQFGITPK